MQRDIGKTLRKALATLEAERTRIEHQIEAVRNALGAVNGRALKATPGARAGRAGATLASPRPRRRRRMSPAERKAVSQRMKMFWASRRAKETKGRKKAAS